MSPEIPDGGDTAPDPLGPVFETEHPMHVLALTLELSHLRSTYLVGRALAEAFPTDADWVNACNTQDFLELVDEFAQVIADVRQTLRGVDPTPEAVAKAMGQHYQRALVAVEAFAELVGIEGEELLRVLVRA